METRFGRSSELLDTGAICPRGFNHFRLSKEKHGRCVSVRLDVMCALTLQLAGGSVIAEHVS